jgi:hypothetical protein
MTTIPSQEILSKPSLATLSFILRNKELWPEGFEWDYTSCLSCAMGLAIRLGWVANEPLNIFKMLKNATEAFNLSKKAAESIFIYARLFYGISMHEVTPIHVADLIDSYLKGNSP